MTSLLVALLVSASPAPAPDAKQLARRSILEYDTGQYEKALADAERAYELDPKVGFLFNIGQCHRALGHPRRAVASFRSYLRERPAAANRAQVEALIAELAAKVPRPAAALAEPFVLPVPSVAPAPSLARKAPNEPPPALAAPVHPVPAAALAATPEGKGHRAAVYLLGGGGLVTAAVGAVLYVLASTARAADHTAAGAGGATYHSIPSGAYQAEATQGNAGLVVGVLGVALLASAGVVALAGGSR